MLLIGDIGGTKTDLAVFPADHQLQPIYQATFKSVEYPSLQFVINSFLTEHPEISFTKAVFGVAGPIVDGKSQITNLPWHISETTLAQTFNLPHVKLLNDLEAIAHAVPHLRAKDLVSLNNHQPDISSGQNKAVIAPGTGLGEAILIDHGGSYQVIASEGGHVDFAPKTLFEIELLKYLLGRYNHVSYERVCSGGLGIPNIYSYLNEGNYASESPAVADALKNSDDPTPVIVQAGLEGVCDLCNQTLNIFVSILGSEASNLVLKVMATGGIYLGGGIPPRILSKLSDGTFMAAFVRKGRFSDMLAKVPVFVILHKKPALLGAAHYGWER